MSAIGRFLTGAGEVLTKDALREADAIRQAEIVAKRDAKLNEYRQAAASAQQQYQSGENQLNREARTGDATAARAHQSQENLLNRTQQSQENQLNRTQQQQNANRAYQQSANQFNANHDLKIREFMLDYQVKQEQLKNAAIVTKGLKLDHAVKETMEKAFMFAADPAVPPQQRQMAIEYLNVRNPKREKERYVLKMNDPQLGEPPTVYRINSDNGVVDQLNPDGTVTRLANPGRGGPSAPVSQAPQSSQSGGQPSQGGVPPSQRGYTRQNPARPKTQADIGKLQKGDVYQPPDGGPLRVRGATVGDPITEAGYESSLFPPLSVGGEDGILEKVRAGAPWRTG